MQAIEDLERRCQTEPFAFDVTSTVARELGEWGAVLAEASRSAPPPDLKASVMAAIAQTPQEAPVSEGRQESAFAHASDVDPQSPADDSPLMPTPTEQPEPEPMVGVADLSAVRVDAGTRQRATQPGRSGHGRRSEHRTPTMWRAVAGAAAVAAVIAGGVIFAERSFDDGTDPVAEFAAAQGADAVIVDLIGDGHSMRLVDPDQNDREMLASLEGLPPLEQGRAYQLWAIVGDADPESVGIFTSDDTVHRADDVPLDAGVVLAITEEPAGGSAGPTSDVLVSAQL